MAPSEHITWFDDNIAWFEALTAEDLPAEVPACPGWDVEHVVNHLAFGLGMAYPHALAAAPDALDDEAFAGVPWPTHYPTGSGALAAFSEHMGACRSAFRAADPDEPCWTYAGAGVARFWFRRAAIETTLHRMDVAGALAMADAPLPAERAGDAVAETIEFALPLAASITGVSPPALSISIHADPATRKLGEGAATAQVSGSGETVLSALWGRGSGDLSIDGEQEVVLAWLGLIERAFSGR